ncbi:MAG: hypothetical protein K0U98_13965 [Deltaproteobacteria bacterium]|nr:hypothetical protein [Deltaproteobacteria bacterium]
MMEESPISSAEELQESPVDQTRPFFEVSPVKLAVLCFFTLHLYTVYWFYQNWKTRQVEGDDVSPILRTLFNPVFFPFLALRVRDKSRFHDFEVQFSPVALAILYFLINLSFNLPDPQWLVSNLAFVPLALLQTDINKLHRQLGFGPEAPTLNRVEALLLGVGAVFWVRAMMRIFSGDAGL